MAALRFILLNALQRGTCNNCLIRYMIDTQRRHVKSHILQGGPVLRKSDETCLRAGTHILTNLLHTSPQRDGKRLPKGVKRKANPLKMNKKGKHLESVHVFEGMTISELADAMKVPIDHVYEVLLFIPNTDQYDEDYMELDAKLVTEIVKKSGKKPQLVSRKVKVKETKKHMDIVRQDPPDPSVLVQRPPVVAIMGHVDHGKTTLLDSLRNSSIVDGEFGGITQHIGAFTVTLKPGEKVCFLDTPGHAAFSAMRARGANLTDIVVLVVAADDGVMPQTIESIQFAQEAGVPIIVAINKIDKNNSNVERTRHMLLEHQVQLEEFGGDVQAVPISALKALNVEDLLEAIVTQAEMMDLKGDPEGKVEGRVIESRLDERRGRLATVIVQRGTLKKGDILVSGLEWAKVKALYDDKGQMLQKASPGMPVEIMGWKGIPSAGDEILQVDSEAAVKDVLEWRKSEAALMKQDEEAIAISKKREEHYKEYKSELVARRERGLHRAAKGPKAKDIVDGDDGTKFSLLLKCDVDGSVEAILDTLDSYDSKKCELDIIHFGVGPVTESDVELAASFGGKIYTFNIETTDKVKKLADSKNVEISSHNVIYRLFEDLKEELTTRLPMVQEEIVIGEAKVLQVFKVSLLRNKTSFVAGSRCTDGTISKKHRVKVLRNEEIIYEGNISSLMHFKEDVLSVKKEMECGIALDDSDFSFQPQDAIVCFDVKDVSQEIDWDPGF